MIPYRHIKKFNIRYCDVDFKDELKPSTILNYLEEAACCSADELGFGYTYVKAKGYAFMVTSIRIEFLRPITLFDECSIHTWPLPPTYVIFDREYEGYAGEEKVFTASSRWCLIDVKSGKIAQSKVIDNQDYSTYNTTHLLEKPHRKIQSFLLEEGDLKFTTKIYNSEYDHNMHVNNTRYADYCFNCFSVAELTEYKLKSFSIAFVKQCKEGDNLKFYRKRLDDCWLVQGINENGEIVTQAEIAFV